MNDTLPGYDAWKLQTPDGTTYGYADDGDDEGPASCEDYEDRRIV